MLVIKAKSKPLKGGFACTTCCTNSSRSGGIVPVLLESHCKVWDQRAAGLGEKIWAELGCWGRFADPCSGLVWFSVGCRAEGLAKGVCTFAEMSIKTWDRGREGSVQSGGVSPARPE